MSHETSYIKTLSDDCRFISTPYRQIRSGQSLIYTKWKKILFYVKPRKPSYTCSTKLHCCVTWVFLYIKTLSDDCRFISSPYRQIWSGQNLNLNGVEKILFYIKPWKPSYTCSLKLHCRVMWVFLYIKTLSDDCRFISSHYRQIRSGQNLIYLEWTKILFCVKPRKPRYTCSTKLHCHVTWVFLYQDTFWWL